MPGKKELCLKNNVHLSQRLISKCLYVKVCLGGNKWKCFWSIPQTPTALLNKLALNDPLQSYGLFLKSPLYTVHLSSCASGWQTGNRVRVCRDWKSDVRPNVPVLRVWHLVPVDFIDIIFAPVSVYNWLIFYLWLWVTFLFDVNCMESSWKESSVFSSIY